MAEDPGQPGTSKDPHLGHYGLVLDTIDVRTKEAHVFNAKGEAHAVTVMYVETGKNCSRMISVPVAYRDVINFHIGPDFIHSSPLLMKSYLYQLYVLMCKVLPETYLPALMADDRIPEHIIVHDSEYFIRRCNYTLQISANNFGLVENRLEQFLPPPQNCYFPFGTTGVERMKTVLLKRYNSERTALQEFVNSCHSEFRCLDHLEVAADPDILFILHCQGYHLHGFFRFLNVAPGKRHAGRSLYVLQDMTSGCSIPVGIEGASGWTGQDRHDFDYRSSMALAAIWNRKKLAAEKHIIRPGPKGKPKSSKKVDMSKTLRDSIVFSRKLNEMITEHDIQPVAQAGNRRVYTHAQLCGKTIKGKPANNKAFNVPATDIDVMDTYQADESYYRGEQAEYIDDMNVPFAEEVEIATFEVDESVPREDSTNDMNGQPAATTDDIPTNFLEDSSPTESPARPCRYFRPPSSTVLPSQSTEVPLRGGFLPSTAQPRFPVATVRSMGTPSHQNAPRPPIRFSTFNVNNILNLPQNRPAYTENTLRENMKTIFRKDSQPFQNGKLALPNRYHKLLLNGLPPEAEVPEQTSPYYSEVPSASPSVMSTPIASSTSNKEQPKVYRVIRVAPPTGRSLLKTSVIGTSHAAQEGKQPYYNPIERRPVVFQHLYPKTMKTSYTAARQRPLNSDIPMRSNISRPSSSEIPLSVKWSNLAASTPSQKTIQLDLQQPSTSKATMAPGGRPRLSIAGISAQQPSTSKSCFSRAPVPTPEDPFCQRVPSSSSQDQEVLSWSPPMLTREDSPQHQSQKPVGSAKRKTPHPREQEEDMTSTPQIVDLEPPRGQKRKYTKKAKALRYRHSPPKVGTIPSSTDEGGSNQTPQSVSPPKKRRRNYGADTIDYRSPVGTTSKRRCLPPAEYVYLAKAKGCPRGRYAWKGKENTTPSKTDTAAEAEAPAQAADATPVAETSPVPAPEEARVPEAPQPEEHQTDAAQESQDEESAPSTKKRVGRPRKRPKGRHAPKKREEMRQSGYDIAEPNYVPTKKPAKSLYRAVTMDHKIMADVQLVVDGMMDELVLAGVLAVQKRDPLLGGLGLDLEDYVPEQRKRRVKDLEDDAVKKSMEEAKNTSREADIIKERSDRQVLVLSVLTDIRDQLDEQEEKELEALEAARRTKELEELEAARYRRKTKMSLKRETMNATRLRFMKQKNLAKLRNEDALRRQKIQFEEEEREKMREMERSMRERVGLETSVKHVRASLEDSIRQRERQESERREREELDRQQRVERTESERKQREDDSERQRMPQVERSEMQRKHREELEKRRRERERELEVVRKRKEEEERIDAERLRRENEDRRTQELAKIEEERRESERRQREEDERLETEKKRQAELELARDLETKRLEEKRLENERKDREEQDRLKTEQKRREEEEKRERQEVARLKQIEEARIEAERLETERLEEERRQKAEQERRDAEKKKLEEEERERQRELARQTEIKRVAKERRRQEKLEREQKKREEKLEAERQRKEQEERERQLELARRKAARIAEEKRKEAARLMEAERIRIAEEEQKRLAQLERERLLKAEAERKEGERLAEVARQEKERRQREEEARLAEVARLERERRQREEEERLAEIARLDRERRQREEKERLAEVARLESERRQREEEERLAEIARLDRERRQREEEERLAEIARLDRERRQREEEERLEAERQRREEEERERVRAAEAKKLREEAEEKMRQEALLQKEQEEREERERQKQAALEKAEEEERTAGVKAAVHFVLEKTVQLEKAEEEERTAGARAVVQFLLEKTMELEKAEEEERTAVVKAVVEDMQEYMFIEECIDDNINKYIDEVASMCFVNCLHAVTTALKKAEEEERSTGVEIVVENMQNQLELIEEAERARIAKEEELRKEREEQERAELARRQKEKEDLEREREEVRKKLEEEQQAALRKQEKEREEAREKATQEEKALKKLKEQQKVALKLRKEQENARKRQEKEREEARKKIEAEVASQVPQMREKTTSELMFEANDLLDSPNYVAENVYFSNRAESTMEDVTSQMTQEQTSFQPAAAVATMQQTQWSSYNSSAPDHSQLMHQPPNSRQEDVMKQQTPYPAPYNSSASGHPQLIQQQPSSRQADIMKQQTPYPAPYNSSAPGHTQLMQQLPSSRQADVMKQHTPYPAPYNSSAPGHPQLMQQLPSSRQADVMKQHTPYPAPCNSSAPGLLQMPQQPPGSMQSHQFPYSDALPFQQTSTPRFQQHYPTMPQNQYARRAPSMSISSHAGQQCQGQGQFQGQGRVPANQQSYDPTCANWTMQPAYPMNQGMPTQPYPYPPAVPTNQHPYNYAQPTLCVYEVGQTAPAYSQPPQTPNQSNTSMIPGQLMHPMMPYQAMPPIMPQSSSRPSNLLVHPTPNHLSPSCQFSHSRQTASVSPLETYTASPVAARPTSSMNLQQSPAGMVMPHLSMFAANPAVSPQQAVMSSSSANSSHASPMAMNQVRQLSHYSSQHSSPSIGTAPLSASYSAYSQDQTNHDSTISSPLENLAVMSNSATPLMPYPEETIEEELRLRNVPGHDQFGKTPLEVAVLDAFLDGVKTKTGSDVAQGSVNDVEAEVRNGQHEEPQLPATDSAGPSILPKVPGHDQFRKTPLEVSFLDSFLDGVKPKTGSDVAPGSLNAVEAEIRNGQQEEPQLPAADSAGPSILPKVPGHDQFRKTPLEVSFLDAFLDGVKPKTGSDVAQRIVNAVEAEIRNDQQEEPQLPATDSAGPSSQPKYFTPIELCMETTCEPSTSNVEEQKQVLTEEADFDNRSTSTASTVSLNNDDVNEVSDRELSPEEEMDTRELNDEPTASGSGGRVASPDEYKLAAGKVVDLKVKNYLLINQSDRIYKNILRKRAELGELPLVPPSQVTRDGRHSVVVYYPDFQRKVKETFYHARAYRLKTREEMNETLKTLTDEVPNGDKTPAATKTEETISALHYFDNNRLKFYPFDEECSRTDPIHCTTCSPMSGLILARYDGMTLIVNRALKVFFEVFYGQIFQVVRCKAIYRKLFPKDEDPMPWDPSEQLGVAPFYGLPIRSTTICSFLIEDRTGDYMAMARLAWNTMSNKTRSDGFMQKPRPINELLEMLSPAKLPCYRMPTLNIGSDHRIREQYNLFWERNNRSQLIYQDCLLKLGQILHASPQLQRPLVEAYLNETNHWRHLWKWAGRRAQENVFSPANLLKWEKGDTRALQVASEASLHMLNTVEERFQARRVLARLSNHWENIATFFKEDVKDMEMRVLNDAAAIMSNLYIPNSIASLLTVRPLWNYRRRDDVTTVETYGNEPIIPEIFPGDDALFQHLNIYEASSIETMFNEVLPSLGEEYGPPSQELSYSAIVTAAAIASTVERWMREMENLELEELDVTALLPLYPTERRLALASQIDNMIPREEEIAADMDACISRSNKHYVDVMKHDSVVGDRHQLVFNEDRNNFGLMLNQERRHAEVLPEPEVQVSEVESQAAAASATALVTSSDVELVLDYVSLPVSQKSGASKRTMSDEGFFSDVSLPSLLAKRTKFMWDATDSESGQSSSQPSLPVSSVASSVPTNSSEFHLGAPEDFASTVTSVSLGITSCSPENAQLPHKIPLAELDLPSKSAQMTSSASLQERRQLTQQAKVNRKKSLSIQTEQPSPSGSQSGRTAKRTIAKSSPSLRSQASPSQLSDMFKTLLHAAEVVESRSRAGSSDRDSSPRTTRSNSISSAPVVPPVSVVQPVTVVQPTAQQAPVIDMSNQGQRGIVAGITPIPEAFIPVHLQSNPTSIMRPSELQAPLPTSFYPLTGMQVPSMSFMSLPANHQPHMPLAFVPLPTSHQQVIPHYIPPHAILQNPVLPQPQVASREGLPMPVILPGQQSPSQILTYAEDAEFERLVQQQMEKNQSSVLSKKHLVTKEYRESCFLFKCRFDYDAGTMEIEQSVIPRKSRKSREQEPLTDETNAIKDLLRTGESTFKIITKEGTRDIDWRATVLANHVVPTFALPPPSPPLKIKPKRGRKPKPKKVDRSPTPEIAIVDTVVRQYEQFDFDDDEEPAEAARSPTERVLATSRSQPLITVSTPSTSRIERNRSVRSQVASTLPGPSISNGQSLDDFFRTLQTRSIPQSVATTTQDAVSYTTTPTTMMVANFLNSMPQGPKQDSAFRAIASSACSGTTPTAPFQSSNHVSRIVIEDAAKLAISQLAQSHASTHIAPLQSMPTLDREASLSPDRLVIVEEDDVFPDTVATSDLLMPSPPLSSENMRQPPVQSALENKTTWDSSDPCSPDFGRNPLVLSELEAEWSSASSRMDNHLLDEDMAQSDTSDNDDWERRLENVTRVSSHVPSPRSESPEEPCEQEQAAVLELEQFEVREEELRRKLEPVQPFIVDLEREPFDEVLIDSSDDGFDEEAEPSEGIDEELTRFAENFGELDEAEEFEDLDEDDLEELEREEPQFVINQARKQKRKMRQYPCGIRRFERRKDERYAQIYSTEPKERKRPEKPSTKQENIDYMEWILKINQAAETEMKRVMRMCEADLTMRQPNCIERQENRPPRPSSAFGWFNRSIYKHYGEFWPLGLARVEHENKYGKPNVAANAIGARPEIIEPYISRCNTPASIAGWTGPIYPYYKLGYQDEDGWSPKKRLTEGEEEEMYEMYRRMMVEEETLFKDYPPIKRELKPTALLTCMSSPPRKSPETNDPRLMELRESFSQFNIKSYTLAKNIYNKNNDIQYDSNSEVEDDDDDYDIISDIDSDVDVDVVNLSDVED